jgi:hypothetical protein
MGTGNELSDNAHLKKKLNKKNNCVHVHGVLPIITTGTSKNCEFQHGPLFTLFLPISGVLTG